MRRTPYLLRYQDPDAEAPGRWRTGRVVLVGACGLGLAAILANAIANPVDPPKEKTTSWAPKSLAAYTLRPEPRPEVQPEPEPESPPAHEDPLPLSSAAAPVQQTPPPEALLAAATESIGVWFGPSIEDASGTAAEDTAAPAVAGGEARGCLIAAGAVIPAQLVTAASSDHGGAPSSPGSPATCSGADGCLGSEAGSTLVGEMGSARDFGQKRGEVMLEALHTLDGRQVDLDPAAGDALGMGGVPGEANLDIGAKALRVAIAVDLGAAYLGGRGDGLSILLGHGGRAIDEWARQDACSRQASSGTTTSRS